LLQEKYDPVPHIDKATVGFAGLRLSFGFIQWWEKSLCTSAGKEESKTGRSDCVEFSIIAASGY